MTKLDIEFIQLCAHGNIGSVREMLDNAENAQALLSSQRYCGFQQACLHDRLEIVQYLLAKTDDPQKMLSSNGFRGFEFACFRESIEVAKYLLETYPGNTQQMIHRASNNPFINACYAGNLKAVLSSFHYNCEPQGVN